MLEYKWAGVKRFQALGDLTYKAMFYFSELFSSWFQNVCVTSFSRLCIALGFEISSLPAEAELTVSHQYQPFRINAKNSQLIFSSSKEIIGERS